MSNLRPVKLAPMSPCTKNETQAHTHRHATPQNQTKSGPSLIQRRALCTTIAFALPNPAAGFAVFNLPVRSALGKQCLRVNRPLAAAATNPHRLRGRRCAFGGALRLLRSHRPPQTSVSTEALAAAEKVGEQVDGAAGEGVVVSKGQAEFLQSK